MLRLGTVNTKGESYAKEVLDSMDESLDPTPRIDPKLIRRKGNACAQLEGILIRDVDEFIVTTESK